MKIRGDTRHGRWIAYAAAAVVCALGRAGPAEEPPLTSGARLERAIRGGETHSFRIPARAGQFIHVIVEQKGVDVRVRLLAPDGREIAQSDVPDGAWGPEEVAAIGPGAGNYTLEVATVKPAAARGQYEVHLLALRDPTPEDSERAAAEALFAGAEKLRTQNTAAARSAAIAGYEKTLPFFEASGERFRQGVIHNRIGLLYARLGEMRSALPRYQQAIRLFHDLGMQGDEGSAINNAGGAYDVLGDLPKAREMYLQALELFRATGETIDEANTLSNIGKLYSDEADWQKAVEYYRQALEIDQTAGEQRREATVLGNLGAAYLSEGEYDTARDYLLRALERGSAFRESSQGAALYNLGRSYQFQVQPRDALVYFERALELYRTLGDRRGEGRSLNSIGLTHAQLGDTTRAFEFLRQAAELLPATGDAREEAFALRNTASLYLDTRQPEKALQSAQQALSGFRAVGDRNSEAQTLLVVAAAERSLGNLTEARRRAEEAMALIERVRAGTGAAETRASYLASKEDAYAFTIDLLMEMHGRDPKAGLDSAALETSERARARSLVEMLAESGAQIREGVDPALLAREREVSDRLNVKGARLFGQPQNAVLQQEIRELENEYQDLEAAIRKSSPRYAALTQPQPLNVGRIQQELLDEDTLLLEYSLGEKRSYLWAVGKNDLRDWELPARDKIEAQVEQVTGLLTARSAVKRLETPAERQKRIAQADAALPAAARELAGMILGPAAGVLGGKKLVVVPDGALQRLPFAMLPVGGGPLIVSHEVVMLPSASALAVLRQEISGRKPAPKMLAVFADPVFDGTDPRVGQPVLPAALLPHTDSTRILEHLAEPGGGASASLKIPRLPYTAQEASQILRVAGSGVNLKAIGFEASRAAATSGQLSDYRYIHFATHGYLDTERPSLSALVLSQIDEKGQAEDGFLRVNDIYNTRLAADLVVLSACQTGLGKEVRGEGLMGLTRAFLYAGAPRVIVSLWNVNDRATADLMASLYRGMLREGKRPSAALREAQLEMRKQKQWESPYYWAAFVQHGEWR